MDPVKMLKDDHRKVEGLFEQFESAEGAANKKKIAHQIIQELEVHAAIEEEIFYPAVKRKAGEEGKEMVAEANEEHHLVHVLLDELKEMKTVNTQYEAKVKVLMEIVKHHVEEEESEMLPKAQEVLADQTDKLGQQMEKRKEALLAEAK